VTISFRARLFVVATLIVTLVFTTVMLIGWTRVLAFEVERLDSRLCLEAKRLQAPSPRGDDLLRNVLRDAAGIEADIAIKLRVPSSEQLMLSVQSGSASEKFQSTHWASEVNFDALSWATVVMPDMAALPGRAEKRQPRPPNVTPDTLDRSRNNPSPGSDNRPNRAPPDRCEVADFRARGAEWRAVRLGAVDERSIVAVDLAATKKDMNSALRQALVLVVPSALLLTALGAWLLASLTMRPVNRLREAMKGMSKNALEQRLPAEGEDREFKDLIDAYNTMLVRLETSFNQASRFSADAAHELKTPLTILQGRIEQAMNASDSGAASLDLIGMQDEVQRLVSITRKLLFLSQSDAGRLVPHRTAIDLTELLDELVANAQMLVTDQVIASRIARGLMFQGDAQLLRQLFNNLISNATRYCTAHGAISVTAEQQGSGFDVTFANSSNEIVAAERARFFERFYRGDASHHRGVDGTGLGLSLAREIARAHGGDITLEPSKLNEVRLRLRLPHLGN
jgi:two-component system, OmpR family, heavy metal sensor histidine kinase CusS